MECTRHESYVIQSIVKRARPELNNEQLYVPKNVVDINLHVSDLHTLLDMESNEVCMVGICRFGEIGKMTFTKATYNAFACKFYCCSFLSNVRETCEKSTEGGQLQLQDIFFSGKMR